VPFVLIVIAVLVLGLLAIGVATYVARPPLPPIADLPLTPLQRRAWAWLAVQLVITAAIVVILAKAGPSRFWEDEAVRLPVTGLFVLGVAAYGAQFGLTYWQASRGKLVLDERDRAILDRAPAAQVPAMLVTVAAWVAVLMETYHSEGQVPVVFLVLIFWSCLFVISLALPAGILLGYRRGG